MKKDILLTFNRGLFMGNAKVPHMKCILGTHEFEKWKIKNFKKTNQFKIWEKCKYCGKVRKVKVK